MSVSKIRLSSETRKLRQLVKIVKRLEGWGKITGEYGARFAFEDRHNAEIDAGQRHARHLHINSSLSRIGPVRSTISNSGITWQDSKINVTTVQIMAVLCRIILLPVSEWINMMPLIIAIMIMRWINRAMSGNSIRAVERVSRNLRTLLRFKLVCSITPRIFREFFLLLLFSPVLSRRLLHSLVTVSHAIFLRI